MRLQGPQPIPQELWCWMSSQNYLELEQRGHTFKTSMNQSLDRGYFQEGESAWLLSAKEPSRGQQLSTARQRSGAWGTSAQSPAGFGCQAASSASTLI